MVTVNGFCMKKNTYILQNFLLEKKISQQQLAEILGVSKQLIHMIVSGERNVSKNIQSKLSELYPDISFEDKETKPKEWLISKRKELRLTQDEMASKLGISCALYRKLEYGERTITSKIINGINNLTSNSSFEDCIYINYCPDTSIPFSSQFKVGEKIALDTKIFKMRNIDIKPDAYYALRLCCNDLYPEFIDGDIIIIDSSQKLFKTGHYYFFEYKGQNYIREITLLPDKIKCTSLYCKEDTFYLSSTKGLTIYGMIIPKVRL